MTMNNVLAYFKNNIKVINRIIKEKTISQKLIHYIQKITKQKIWWMCHSKNKCLFIQNKIRLWMKIINNMGEVNFGQWMKMAKGYNGFS